MSKSASRFGRVRQKAIEIVSTALDILIGIGDSLGDRSRVKIVDCRIDLNDEDFDVAIHLQDAKRFGADGMLFGHDLGPLDAKHPWAIVFDRSKKMHIEEEASKMHHRLWVYGKIPFAVFFSQTEVLIYDCLNAPTVRLADNIRELYIKEFRRASLDRGLFSTKVVDESKLIPFLDGSIWEDKANNRGSGQRKWLDRKNSSHELLLSDLRKVRDSFLPRIPKTVINKVIMMSILVKYLEEKTDGGGERVFKVGFFQEFSKSGDRFIDVLRRKGAVLELFTTLNNPESFNGDVFELKDSKEVKERQLIRDCDFSALADFFVGERLGTGAPTLFPVYYFKDLPVELISSIYEELVVDKREDSSKGVVYTPPFLVEFLLSQAMPYEDIHENYKILDPSCGSGVFLVSAFRRIVAAWRKKNSWEKEPSESVLREILKTNITGIEIIPSAAKIASFSLAIALCDQLSPLKIRELKFDVLKGNIITSDYFDIVNSREHESLYDLVIGNPPFDSKFDTAGVQKYLADRESIHDIDSMPAIPDQQLCLAFLEASFRLTNPKGKVCLIQFAGPSIYNNSDISLAYREFIFKNFPINEVWDFTPLKDSLFGDRGIATTALISGVDFSERIMHVIARATHASVEKLFLEFDRYDVHFVDRREIVKGKYAWKCNLLGGGRMRELVEKLSKINSLGAFLDQQKAKTRGWDFGEGYTPLRKERLDEIRFLESKDVLTSAEMVRLNELQKKPKPAEYLTGKPFFRKRNGVCEIIEDGVVKDQYFWRPGKEKRFNGPLLMLSETMPPAFKFVESGNAAYKNGVFGIIAPEIAKGDLFNVYESLRHEKNQTLFSFLMATRSSRIFVLRGTSSYAGDIKDLPILENGKSIDLDWFDRLLIKDVLAYQIPQIKKGHLSDMMRPILKGKKSQVLADFNKLFLEIVNGIYKDFHACDPIEASGVRCIAYRYGPINQEVYKKVQEALKTGKLSNLLKQVGGDEAKFTRIIRFYYENMIFLIKPDSLRYWTPIVAGRDADMVMGELFDQGY